MSGADTDKDEKKDKGIRHSAGDASGSGSTAGSQAHEVHYTRGIPYSSTVTQKKKSGGFWTAFAIITLGLVVISAVMIFFQMVGESSRTLADLYGHDTAASLDAGKKISQEHPKVLLVNKEVTLPDDWEPENLTVANVHWAMDRSDPRCQMQPEASEALEKLFAAGKKAGVELVGVSAYRSFLYQRAVYWNVVRRSGQAYADVYSARPEASEHRTGLSIDVSTEAMSYQLYTRFGETREGRWLADNCADYGFIIRYPKDREDITGYNYEPWHIRYVGKTLAEYLTKKGLTLDQYDNAVGIEELEK